MTEYYREIDTDTLWPTILKEGNEAINTSPLLKNFFYRNIVRHASFRESLAYVLAEKLADMLDQNEGVAGEKVDQWQSFILTLMDEDDAIEQAAIADLVCQLKSNASIKDHYTPLLFFGSYQALQSYRIAHACWISGKASMASYIQSKVVSVFGVDIHPAAFIGKGIFIDHAVGIVVGETAVIEDEVTLFQNITLGGTGKGVGDRHPKVRKGAFIGSGALIFGNVEIGENAKIGGGAVIVKDVGAGTTMVGPIAKQHLTK